MTFRLTSAWCGIVFTCIDVVRSRSTFVVDVRVLVFAGLTRPWFNIRRGSSTFGVGVLQLTVFIYTRGSPADGTRYRPRSTPYSAAARVQFLSRRSDASRRQKKKTKCRLCSARRDYVELFSCIQRPCEDCLELLNCSFKDFIETC